MAKFGDLLSSCFTSRWSPGASGAGERAGGHAEGPWQPLARTWDGSEAPTFLPFDLLWLDSLDYWPRRKNY